MASLIIPRLDHAAAAPVDEDFFDEVNTIVSEEVYGNPHVEHT